MRRLRGGYAGSRFLIVISAGYDDFAAVARVGGVRRFCGGYAGSGAGGFVTCPSMVLWFYFIE